MGIQMATRGTNWVPAHTIPYVTLSLAEKSQGWWNFYTRCWEVPMLIIIQQDVLDITLCTFNIFCKYTYVSYVQNILLNNNNKHSTRIRARLTYGKKLGKM